MPYNLVLEFPGIHPISHKQDTSGKACELERDHRTSPVVKPKQHKSYLHCAKVIELDWLYNQNISILKTLEWRHKTIFQEKCFRSLNGTRSQRIPTGSSPNCPVFLQHLLTKNSCQPESPWRRRVMFSLGHMFIFNLKLQVDEE